MRRLALVRLLALGILLFPATAAALGLGTIEMQSALNERLDAEIPLRGVPAGESDQIIVALASEQAFRDVGLRRPFSLTRLRFEVRQHDDGQYYVHVTSSEPIVEPFLSFLIEVDWPSGNLLREYTVLLDPPVFVSDARASEEMAADESAPAAAPTTDSVTAAGVPADIERDTQAGEQVEPEPEPAVEPEPETAAAAEPVDGNFSDLPVFLQVEREAEQAEERARQQAESAEPEPEPAAEPEPAVEAEATTQAYDADPAQYGPVERGETLWQIASRLKRADMTVQQMMLALLRYNPDAFINDNINLVKQGYVLRVPDAEAVLSLSAQQAVAQVGEQNALWQEYRAAIRSRARTAEKSAADETAAAEESGATAEPGLKIVGSEEGTAASSGESATATSTSTAATREELNLAREQLESAVLEKEELESRVGELEQTVEKMERLIEVREDQLARLQEQLSRLQQDEEVDAAIIPEDSPAQDGSATDGTDAEVEPATDAMQDEEEAVEAAEPATGTTAETDEPGAGGDSTSEDSASDQADEPMTAEPTDTESDTAALDQGEATAAETEQETGTAAEQTLASADGIETQSGDSSTQTQATGAAVGETESSTARVRVQSREPGWMETLGGIWDSVSMTVGGMFAGAGIGTLMTNPLTLPIAGAAIVLLLLGALLIARRRRESSAAESDTEFADTVTLGGERDEEDQFAALMQNESSEDVAVEESTDDEWEAGQADRGDHTQESEAAESALMSEEFDLDDLDQEDRTVSSDEASEDDTLAEADVYIAYGLHQQAEDLLNLALQEQPDRLDYQAKMLETLYGAGKADEFVRRAESMQQKVSDPSDSHWQRTVAMGKELAPDNALFQQEVDESLKPADTTVTQAPGPDFEVGGEGDDSTDLDFSFEEDSGDSGEEDDDEFGRTLMLDREDLPAADEEQAGASDDETVAGSADEMDLDLSDFDLDEGEEEVAASSPRADGGAGEDSEATAAGAAEGMDLDLSDFETDDSDATQSSAVPTAESSEADEEFEFDLGDLELDEGESEPGAGDTTAGAAGDEEIDLDLGDESDAEATVTTAGGGMEAGTDTREATDSGDDEAFDFDLGDLDEPDEPDEGAQERLEGAEADDETMLADADDEMLDLGDLELDSEPSLESPPKDTEHDETEAATPDEQTMSVDSSSIGALGDLETDEDTASADATAPAGLGDETDVPDTRHHAARETDESESNEDTMSFDSRDESIAALRTEVSTDDLDSDFDSDEDEFDTMLDLARAYMDMGDSESAKAALEEVAESGNQKQRDEAQGLLETV